MAENEGMEGKDLATEKKKEFKEILLEQIENLKNGESKMVIGEMEATKFGDQAVLKVRGKSIAIVNGRNIQYNLVNFEELKKELSEEGQTLDDLGLPDLQSEIDKIQKQNSEKAQGEEQKDHDEEVVVEQENNEEETEEEKDDEKPELENEGDDLKKEEIAKKYNVNSSQVIHISRDEKVTEDERFQGLVRWAQDYDDIYVIPGEDPYSIKFIGERNGEKEEIESANNQIGGKNPDITVKRIDGEKITEIKPLAMYEIDSETSIAIVKNEHGEPEALFCRQQEGNEKEYWGSVIPEASGKNVMQQEPEVREFMDHKSNSGLDLSKKADELSRQEGLEKRGLPSDKEGVQVEEIQGDREQNRTLNIEEIAEDLMKKDGIKDRTTVPPGYYENKAGKVLKEMEGNDNLTYEQAVEQVEEQGQREEGGRTPGEIRKDPRRG